MTTNQIDLLNEMSKEDLIKKCVSLIVANNLLRSNLESRKYIIKNTNMRLKKVRKEIDYIIDHPYAKSNTKQI